MSCRLKASIGACQRDTRFSSNSGCSFEGSTRLKEFSQEGAFIPDLLAHFFAVVGLVGCDGEWRSRRIQYLFDDLAVVDLSARHREAQRPALAVDNRMDFCGSTAAADADRLILLPPFAPLAAR